MNPRVSIGMPVRNGDRFLEAALESILAQTFVDFELILSDNASTDSTQDICRRFAKTDKRIRYCRNSENLGAAGNYNRVFQLASGTYFKWASHDDVCRAELLSSCVKVLDSDRSVVLCYARVKVIDEYGKVVKSMATPANGCVTEPYIRFRDILFAPACNAVFGLIRSAWLRKTPLIGPYRGSDQVLLAELSLKGQFYVVPEYLFFRRDHPDTSLRGNKTDAAISAWFDPSLRKHVFLSAWRLGFEYTRALERASLSPLSRLLCYGEMARWIKSRRIALARELCCAARAVIKNELVVR